MSSHSWPEAFDFSSTELLVSLFCPQTPCCFSPQVLGSCVPLAWNVPLLTDTYLPFETPHGYCLLPEPFPESQAGLGPPTFYLTSIILCVLLNYFNTTLY